MYINSTSEFYWLVVFRAESVYRYKIDAWDRASLAHHREPFTRSAAIIDVNTVDERFQTLPERVRTVACHAIRHHAAHALDRGPKLGIGMFRDEDARIRMAKTFARTVVPKRRRSRAAGICVNPVGQLCAIGHVASPRS